MVVVKLFLVMCLLFPSKSYGDMGDYANEYLLDLESRKASVFLSCCGSKTDVNYTAILVFEVDKKKGLLIEMNKNIVVNLANVSLENQGLTIEETHGGVFSYDRVKKLVANLVENCFYLMTPFKAADIRKSKRVPYCR